MTLPLKWEFSGGKIEPGESEIDCIKRKIVEELNIKIEVKGRLTAITHQYSNLKIKLIPSIYIRGFKTYRTFSICFG